MQAALIVGGVAMVLLVATAIAHIRFVAQPQLIDNAWANDDAELRRRYDLISNLVRTVEGYATHEREVLQSVVEAHPDLKADAHLLEPQQELAITEDRIQAARPIFNGNGRDYNRRVESVPSNLVAAVSGFRRCDYFELEAAVRDAGPPRVETP